MVAPKSSLFWRFFNTSMKGHVAIFRLTGGRIGGSMVGGPILLLHHVGAKSGKKRISPLLYLADGDRMVIVGSKGGYTKHPGWFHNLKAHPDTQVEVPREGKVAVRAREATPAERDELLAAGRRPLQGLRRLPALDLPRDPARSSWIAASTESPASRERSLVAWGALDDWRPGRRQLPA